MAARIPRAFRTFQALVGFLILGTCIIIYSADRRNVRASIHWQYFNEIITGSWSPTQPDKLHKVDGEYISDDVYLIGLIGAIVLNFGPLIALISAALALIERKTEMDLLTAFAERDLNIEVTLVTSVTDAVEDLIVPGRREDFLRVVHAAIEEANKDWWGPNLNEEYGPERAEKMRAKMRDLNITP